jgi:hypothetical protein
MFQHYRHRQKNQIGEQRGLFQPVCANLRITAGCRSVSLRQGRLRRHAGKNAL